MARRRPALPLAPQRGHDERAPIRRPRQRASWSRSAESSGRRLAWRNATAPPDNKANEYTDEPMLLPPARSATAESGPVAGAPFCAPPDRFRRSVCGASIGRPVGSWRGRRAGKQADYLAGQMQLRLIVLARRPVFGRETMASLRGDLSTSIRLQPDRGARVGARPGDDSALLDERERAGSGPGERKNSPKLWHEIGLAADQIQSDANAPLAGAPIKLTT